jgi:hypothetical protein
MSEDELMHWKYIKREKKNGRWVYYYKDDNYDKAKQKYDLMKKASQKVLYRQNKIVSKNQPIIDNLNESYNKKYGDKAGNNEHWPEFFDKAKPYVEAINKAKGETAKIYKRTSEAELEYKRAKRIYDNSKGHKVASLLNRASTKIDKAKNWVTSLVKKKRP